MQVWAWAGASQGTRGGVGEMEQDRSIPGKSLIAPFKAFPFHHGIELLLPLRGFQLLSEIKLLTPFNFLKAPMISLLESEP